MDLELTASTPAGCRAVDLAESHLPTFAGRSAGYDRDNRYVAENVEDARDSGLLAMCRDVADGGLGVASIHDTAVVMSRVARACPSTALALNMFVTQDLMATILSRRGDAPAVAAGRPWVRRVSSVTEPGASWGVPYTRAEPDGDGYVLYGRKTFATNIEIADVVLVSVRVPSASGWLIGEVSLDRDQPGLTVGGDWDALGMRGTASHSLTLDGCRIPAGRLRVFGPLTAPRAEDLVVHSAVEFPLSSAYLGIAEAALAHVAALAGKPMRPPYHGTLGERAELRHELAELELLVFAARAAVQHAGLVLDRAAVDTGKHDEAHFHRIFAAWQCAKLAVQRAANDAVARAMTAAGGAAFSAGHPLSRMYRDARAAVFHQPYNPLDAYRYIGFVSAGLDPFEELRAALDAESATLLAPGSDAS